MLALTPVPLQTAGERALFAELTRWDTGGSVRGAVVASLPVVDGPRERRLCDAVLFVPEGLVVRVVEVVRQSGVVTALPEGAWTIGPDAGRPGDVLQLAGGGSTPLAGLVRAGTDAAVRLRDAGLEPGRIARLTVLVGDLTGLVPADGDLGEGDQVALLDPRSLLLGIARTARHTAVDDPRLWTTADVRTALEALGLAGRVPTVQQLNGEGFPYSPYVLRTPELLAPAAMAAAPRSAVPEPAVARLPTPHHPTPSAAPPEAPHHPVRPEPGAGADAGPRDTLVGPTVGVPADETGGTGGLFAGAGPADPEPSAPLPPAADRVFRPDGAPLAGRRRPGSSRRIPLVLLAALLAVAVLGTAGALLLGRDDGRATPAPSAAGGTAVPGAVGGPQPGDREEVDGRTFVAQQVQVDPTCVGNAYGAVADFFTDTDCRGLARALYSTDVGGRPVVVSVSAVDTGDPAGARALRALADRNGSGNVSDLLREGVRYAGGPERLADAEYASAVSGSTVTIVETAWAASGSTGGAADLDVLASSALVLPMPHPTAG
ncbi:hypothetical protein DQ238_19055 [Geodermatophilus sp. TF02-6]|uniref:hypothetical protein n=1 Tax=Geodermatophilus sp. TF02-6 TaxID=2250575 RepID=UPI000DE88B50|nr:hypothetical protein [Geodermatophilus sp. TF02-6]RBY75731.1 hypothetical protein DQ238_19055 [Geodermatophilus sp. TF02-6]